MDLSIEQSCPSCGAAIVLSEDDRLILCSYCGVYNYRLDNQAARYLLPSKHPKHIASSQLFYIPYLRFKGAIYYVKEHEVAHKIIDTTRIGLEDEKLPATLGLRPQAMKLIPVVASIGGAFAKQTLPSSAVFEQAVKILELFDGKNDSKVYHRAFIGETLSRIYQPCYVHDGVIFDAVLNKPLGQEKMPGNMKGTSMAAQASWEPQFISTICPQCSGLLCGERDSLVLSCRNCETFWQENNNKFHLLDAERIQSDDPSAVYFPFWRIQFRTTGISLENFGDYLRFTNQPLMVHGKFDAMPLCFWIPAFKINPKAFLQVAAQLTIAQGKIPAGCVKKPGNDYPVTLAHKEALQAIKSIIAVTTLNKTTRLPLLQRMTIDDAQCFLTYLPFSLQGHDYTQEHTTATLLSAAVRYGRKL